MKIWLELSSSGFEGGESQCASSHSQNPSFLRENHEPEDFCVHVVSKQKKERRKGKEKKTERRELICREKFSIPSPCLSTYGYHFIIFIVCLGSVQSVFSLRFFHYLHFLFFECQFIMRYDLPLIISFSLYVSLILTFLFPS